MWLILLIWGLPTSGKTTLSEKLGKKFNIPYISADHLRSAFQKKNPIYKDHSTRTPEEYYREFDTWEKSSKEHFRWLSEYYDDFELYVRTVSQQYFWDKNKISCIIEGDTLTPEFFSRIEDIENILCITLINTDIEKMRSIVYRRWVWDLAESYPDYIKELEMQWLEYSIW
jgi:2-phosphoglycerate kinase